MSTTRLELRNVSRYYGEHLVVDNLNLKLHEGEVVGLLGLNGAGKSTTLKLLSGLLTPSFGQVLLEGHDLQTMLPSANQRIGYLPEHPPLYTQQRVDEYLYHIAQLYNLDKIKARQRIETCTELCGLSEHGQHIIARLSKGYQQRLGIAKTLLHEPDIIILDEPTVGLDPKQLSNIRTLFRKLSETSSVIISSHMLHEIQAVADRVVILHRGEIVLDQPNNNQTNLEALFSDVIFDRV